MAQNGGAPTTGAWRPHDLMLNLDYSPNTSPAQWDFPAALAYLNLTAAQMQRAQALTLVPYTFPGSTDDYRAKVDDGDGYTTGGGIFSFQALAGATYSVSGYSFFDPSGTEIFDSQGVQLFLGPRGSFGSSYMSFVAPSSGTYYIKPNWNLGSYYTGYSMSLYEDIDTAGPKVASQDPANQGQAAAAPSRCHTPAITATWWTRRSTSPPAAASASTAR